KYCARIAQGPLRTRSDAQEARGVWGNFCEEPSVAQAGQGDIQNIRAPTGRMRRPSSPRIFWMSPSSLPPNGFVSSPAASAFGAKTALAERGEGFCVRRVGFVWVRFVAAGSMSVGDDCY